MVFAIVVTIILIIQSAKSEKICFEDILIISACALGGGILGGWLLYIFVTYSWAQIIAWIHSGNFHFLNGGIVFYGGLLGGMLGALLGLSISKRKAIEMIPHIAPYIPLGHAIGRVGCVMAGCCHGMPYTGLFAMYYPNAISGLPASQGCFPVQLLEAFLNILLFLFLLNYRKRCKDRILLLFFYLSGYGIIRFFVEFLRGDRVRGYLYGFSTSQWISLILVSVCLFYTIYRKCFRSSKP